MLLLPSQIWDQISWISLSIEPLTNKEIDANLGFPLAKRLVLATIFYIVTFPIITYIFL